MRQFFISDQLLGRMTCVFFVLMFVALQPHDSKANQLCDSITCPQWMTCHNEPNPDGSIQGRCRDNSEDPAAPELPIVMLPAAMGIAGLLVYRVRRNQKNSAGS